jgi:hypothetical protein
VPYLAAFCSQQPITRVFLIGQEHFIARTQVKSARDDAYLGGAVCKRQFLLFASELGHLCAVLVQKLVAIAGTRP